MVRIILDVDTPEEAYLALQAAKSLLNDGYDDCVYGYNKPGGSIHYWARRTKTGVSSTKSRNRSTS